MFAESKSAKIYQAFKNEFERRYCRPGTPLARYANVTGSADVCKPDFSDWKIRFKREAVEKYAELNNLRMTKELEQLAYLLMESQHLVIMTQISLFMVLLLVLT